MTANTATVLEIAAASELDFGGISAAEAAEIVAGGPAAVALLDSYLALGTGPDAVTAEQLAAARVEL